MYMHIRTYKRKFQGKFGWQEKIETENGYSGVRRCTTKFHATSYIYYIHTAVRTEREYGTVQYQLSDSVNTC